MKIEAQKSSNRIKEFISVVIPFRNESETILDNLKCLENQNIPKDKYEVIYVDDNSDDDSKQKLENSISEFNILVYSVEESDLSRAHKKRAIELGIGKANGEIILLTDADCTNEPTWINTMLSEFSENTGLVSGAVKFNSDKTLFGKLQQLEFAGLILSGAGLIGNGTPIICSSANLAFRKSVFNEVGGYKDLMGLSSGDDELLMQKIANDTDYEVKFCFNRKALVSTNPNESLEAFAQQRKRWASKGLFYKNKRIVAQLFLIFFFYIGLIAQLFMGLFVDKIFLYTFILSLLAKMLVEYSIIKKGIGILIKKISLGLFLLAELLHIPYIIYSAVSGAFGNFTWKERELKR
ncbi:MAG: glycosyltransferase [Chlorobi bacterium]|nr:glycosyltransferase [Chlorobiota bacterium]